MLRPVQIMGFPVFFAPAFHTQTLKKDDVFRNSPMSIQLQSSSRKRTANKYVSGKLEDVGRKEHRKP